MCVINYAEFAKVSQDPQPFSFASHQRHFPPCTFPGSIHPKGVCLLHKTITAFNKSTAAGGHYSDRKYESSVTKIGGEMACVFTHLIHKTPTESGMFFSCKSCCIERFYHRKWYHMSFKRKMSILIIRPTKIICFFSICCFEKKNPSDVKLL